MTEKQTKTDLGRIKIHSHAISSIASIATREVEGVLRIYSGPVGRLCGFLGMESDCGAVKVDLKDSNEVDISVSIIVEYGRDIPVIANRVQESIRQAIEKMTGLALSNIDVKVKGIEKKK